MVIHICWSEPGFVEFGSAEMTVRCGRVVSEVAVVCCQSRVEQDALSLCDA